MVWFTKTTTDLLLACDAPGCGSVITLDDSGIFAASEYARRQGWKIGGAAYCPKHIKEFPQTVMLGGRKTETRRKEILNSHPLAKEYTG